MNIGVRKRTVSPRAMQGLSLIEMMIAMVLGLLVVGAAIGIFLSNRQVYRATEGVGRLQENARVAFELMARDVREAAGNPCVNNLPVANVLNSPASSWWSDIDQWGRAVQGYAAGEELPGGTGTLTQVAGTEALLLMSGDNNVVTVSAHDPASFIFTVNTNNHGFREGDLAVACNARQASIFQVSAVGTNTISHGAGGTPGNCTANLGLPAACGGGAAYQFSPQDSMLVRLNASRWFIANNPAQRPALYQAKYIAGSVVNQEVAEGVTGMTIGYLLAGAADYVDVAGVGNNWANVVALRIDLLLESPDRIGSDGRPISRHIIQVASLRNRNP